MSLTMRWAGAADLDRVVQTRTHCFGSAAKEFEFFKKWMLDEKEAQAGDYLLAERDGVAVGTATSMTFRMWMRGAALCVPGCGVGGGDQDGAARAGAATDKTKQVGVATEVMRELLRMARRRGHVISALMPFRASYYDHFGYGLVERRNAWTVPVAILPSGSSGAIRFFEKADLPGIQACRQRVVEKGQCDLERTAERWANVLEKWQDGFLVVDPDEKGTIRGWMAFKNAKDGTRDVVDVTDIYYEDTGALMRQLHFLGALKDQYSTVRLELSADLPLNRLLREPQIPHRPVNHPHSECRPYTRMQIRVLDHKKMLEALHLPGDARGRAVVAVHETEGTISKLAIEVEAGKVSVKASEQTPDMECTDRAWAGVVSGDISASAARTLGTIHVSNPSSLLVLDAFSRGPIPYCTYPF